jgi:hypothetical protein
MKEKQDNSAQRASASEAAAVQVTRQWCGAVRGSAARSDGRKPNARSELRSTPLPDLLGIVSPWLRCGARQRRFGRLSDETRIFSSSTRPSGTLPAWLRRHGIMIRVLAAACVVGAALAQRRVTRATDAFRDAGCACADPPSTRLGDGAWLETFGTAAAPLSSRAVAPPRPLPSAPPPARRWACHLHPRRRLRPCRTARECRLGDSPSGGGGGWSLPPACRRH